MPSRNRCPSEPIQIAERIVLNYYTAKRLLGALHMSVQRHESAFGTLETDSKSGSDRARMRRIAARPDDAVALSGKFARQPAVAGLHPAGRWRTFALGD